MSFEMFAHIFLSAVSFQLVLVMAPHAAVTVYSFVSVNAFAAVFEHGAVQGAPLHTFICHIVHFHFQESVILYHVLFKFKRPVFKAKVGGRALLQHLQEVCLCHRAFS